MFLTGSSRPEGLKYYAPKHLVIPPAKEDENVGIRIRLSKKEVRESFCSKFMLILPASRLQHSFKQHHL